MGHAPAGPLIVLLVLVAAGLVLGLAAAAPANAATGTCVAPTTTDPTAFISSWLACRTGDVQGTFAGDLSANSGYSDWTGDGFAPSGYPYEVPSSPGTFPDQSWYLSGRPLPTEDPANPGRFYLRAAQEAGDFPPLASEGNMPVEGMGDAWAGDAATAANLGDESIAAEFVGSGALDLGATMAPETLGLSVVVGGLAASPVGESIISLLWGSFAHPPSSDLASPGDSGTDGFPPTWTQEVGHGICQNNIAGWQNTDEGPGGFYFLQWGGGAGWGEDFGTNGNPGGSCGIPNPAQVPAGTYSDQTMVDLQAYWNAAVGDASETSCPAAAPTWLHTKTVGGVDWYALVETQAQYQDAVACVIYADQPAAPSQVADSTVTQTITAPSTLTQDQKNQVGVALATDPDTTDGTAPEINQLMTQEPATYDTGGGGGGTSCPDCGSGSITSPSCTVTIPSVNFAPFSGIPLGGRFPFGILTWLSGVVGTLNATAQAPTFTIPIGSHSLTIDLSGADVLMEFLRPILGGFTLLGAVWFFGRATLGWGAGAPDPTGE